MKKIKNVLICGLGGVGCIYAQKLLTNKEIQLKVLVDESRLKRYSDTPRQINGKKYNFDYILPNNTEYKPDLILITAKYSGLKDTIINIRNFVSKETIPSMSCIVPPRSITAVGIMMFRVPASIDSGIYFVMYFLPISVPG